MANQRKPQAAPILRDFKPLAALWEGAAPLYPSQQSARWAVRQMRKELIEAGAIALLRNRTMVNLEKLTAVAERNALEQMRKRHGA